MSEDRTAQEILEALKEPFGAHEIHWRVGSVTKKKDKATALAYLDARDVMKRLDDVLGIENWKDSYEAEPPRTVRKRDRDGTFYNEQVCGRVIGTISIRINGEWIAKSDGAGETAGEGEKGGISDAFKRAAVKLGVGRYLYYLGTSWHPIDEWKKLKSRPTLPQWALPKAKEAPPAEPVPDAEGEAEEKAGEPVTEPKAEEKPKAKAKAKAEEKPKVVTEAQSAATADQLHLIDSLMFQMDITEADFIKAMGHLPAKLTESEAETAIARLKKKGNK
jgi:hypothetical protein